MIASLILALLSFGALPACLPGENNTDSDWEIEQSQDEPDNSDEQYPQPQLEPAIEVVPPHISFPYHESNTLAETLEIHNTGDAPLEIESIELTDDSEYFEIVDVIGGDDNGAATLDDDSGESVTVVVEFDHHSFEPIAGVLEITSDDPDLPIKTVELSGNSAVPCIDVTNSSQLDFGSVAIGHSTTRLVTVQNCSLHAELQIEDIEVSNDDVFSLYGQTADDIDPLAPGESSSFLMEFAPEEEGAHQGQVDIFSDSPDNPVQTVQVFGEGVDTDCIVAEALGAPSAGSSDTVGFDDSVEVEASNAVSLKAEIVDDAGHDDLSYSWKLVESPMGSLDDLGKPDGDETSLRVQSIGEYAVQLVVYGDDGVASCEPSTVHIVSTTDEDIHIQLTWLSPRVELAGGVDIHAARGVDLDLHYVRPGGNWGDPNNSIYWQHSEQDWNSDGQFNARLYIDDLWGADPENLIHSAPEEGAHHVGVHVYRDYCWEPTDATVRVHFKGELVYEQTRRLHNTDNFWFVGDIDWGDDPEFVDIDEVSETHSLISHHDIYGDGAC